MDRILRQIVALRTRHEAEIRRLVAQAAASGIRSQDIALALGISRATLWRHYAEDLRRAGVRPLPPGVEPAGGVSAPPAGVSVPTAGVTTPTAGVSAPTAGALRG